MPKARSAILSSLRGSLRGGPTFRETTQTDAIVMQTRPVPTDRRTAKQAAVRDAYSRLAYLWSNLSQLDKEPYQIMAEAQDLTAWNCFLKYHMPIMKLTPRFYCPFSEGEGPSLQNFAIDGETGLKNDSTWSKRNDFNCLSYGSYTTLNTFNRPGYYDDTTDLSALILFNKSTISPGPEILIGTKSWSTDTTGFILYLYDTAYLIFDQGTGTNHEDKYAPADIPTNQINAVGFTKSGRNLTIYVNGTATSQTLVYDGPALSTTPLTLGGGYDGSYPYTGNILISSLFHTAIPVATFRNLEAHYRQYLS